MINILKLTMLISALLFSSCINFLNEKVFSDVEGDNMYQTFEQADLAVIGIYANLSSNKGYNRLWQGLTSYGTDESRCYFSGKLNDNFFKVSNFTHTTSDNNILNLYSNLYNGIALCNDVYHNVTKMPAISENNRRRLQAEALFLRSFFYFNLVQLWGDVRLITEVPDFSNVTDRNFSRSSVKEVYAQIIEDMTFAKANLPDRSFYKQTGRATRLAAQGMLAKIYLTIASGSRFGVSGYDSFDYMAYYALAKENAHGVIYNNEGYDLLNNYGDVFSWKNKYNNEIIFDANFAIGGQGNQWPKMGGIEGSSNFPYYQCGWAGRAYLRPSAYLSLCVYGHENLTIKEDGTISAFSTNDTRFTQNIATSNLSNTTGKPANNLKGNVTNWAAYKFNIREDKHNGYTWQATPMNHPILRFAEVLLIYAESAAMVNLNDPSAYNEWNKIRNRAKAQDTDPEYLKDLSPGSFADVYEMMDEMMDERMREFCFEGQRRFDTYRTSRFLNEFDRMKSRLQNLADQYGNSKFTDMIMDCDITTPKVDQNLQPYHILFPIPQYEMNIVTNPDYKQNPGWKSSAAETAEL